MNTLLQIFFSGWNRSHLTDGDLKLSKIHNNSFPKTISWADTVFDDNNIGKNLKDKNEWNEVRGAWDQNWIIDQINISDLKPRLDIANLQKE